MNTERPVIPPETRSRRIKVGVVGCGVVATAYYLPYLRRQPDAEIVAVCDTRPARTAACVRLFGAKEAYSDYYEMIRRADIECVFILTAPGTHVDFTLAALEAGKHVLLQKPMALDLAGAERIVEATRRTRLKVLVEPSDHSPIDPVYAHLRDLIRKGVLGEPYYFNLMPKGPEHEHPSLGGNPYGEGAFYAKDSGGILFDFPYGPTQIVTLLGPCKRVSGNARCAKPDRAIVDDRHYDAFLEQCTDPDACNYWTLVSSLPRDRPVQMQAPDTVFCTYDLAEGWHGVFHTPRIFLPTLKGTSYGDFQAFGTEGNLVFGAGYRASIISHHRALLPHVDDDGWYHIPETADWSRATWPIPPEGAFNYYHESTRHLLDCIHDDVDPIVNVEWGRHITEMMWGAIESSRTGRVYHMTTTVDW
ncbi:MAG: gfo/Idh/MocA family oxidoreductase [Verrucomicrobia bacterium]|nr:MAG: gfo/Idh/MocA family oxidoreductase [Verrucomicrobiota bacterium]